MDHVLANPEFLIEGNGRLVAIIGLNVDNPSTALCSDLELCGRLGDEVDQAAW
jgi:hypothetical protein